MSLVHLIVAIFVAASSLSFVVALPTIDKDAKLSIRALDIVNNDHAATENHPLMGVYTDWLQTSPHAEFIRSNASTVMGRYPSFHSVDCYKDRNTCMLTSRMRMSKETAALAQQEQLSRRQWFWDTGRLVTELHYKTYHWLGNGDEKEWAGFEQYLKWDWNCGTTLYSTTGGAMLANHKMGERKGARGREWVATVDITITHDAKPLHTEVLEAVFSCGLFTNKCCVWGGSESLFVGGKPEVWPQRVERTCHTGKQSFDKCED